MPSIRLSVVLLLAAIFWSAFATPASAHTDLQSSTPADGSMHVEPVSVLNFVFNDVIEAFVEGYTVTTLAGVEVTIDEVVQLNIQTVEVRLDEPVAEAFVATWAVVAGDSHPITGSIVVSVEVAEPTPTPQPTVAPVPVATEVLVDDQAVPIPTATPTPTSTPSPTPTVSPYPAIEYVGLDELEAMRDARAQLNLEIIDGQAKAEKIWLVLRWATYLATTVAIGGLVLASAIKGEQRRQYWQSTRSMVLAAVGLLMVLSVLMVGLQLASLTGRLSDIFRVTGWDRSFRWNLRTGVQWRLAGAALLGGIALRKNPPRTVLLLATIAPVLVSFSVLGHISAHGPRFVGLISTIVHVGAISIWVGGIIATAITLRRDRSLDVHMVAKTLSRLAVYALVATVAAGVSLSMIQFDSFAELWNTEYGQRLMIKLSLVWLVVCLGTVQRFGIVPRLRTHGARVSVYFSRMLKVEVVTVLIVFAVAAWLLAAGLETDY